MAAGAGRSLLIAYDSGAGAVDIVGQTTGTITVNREAIEITDKSDAGVRKILADAIGTFSVDISFEGILKDTIVAELAFDNTPSELMDCEITIGGLGTLTGTWFLGNFEVSGEDGANAIGYTASLMSGDDVTFTAL